MNENIVETTAGKVRGASSVGIFSFKGIPYGASTAASNRFMPPQKPVPWTGVRDALAYGPMAMQDDRVGLWRMLPIHDGNMTPEGHARSEDCLALNLWTPGMKDGRKRPVMVWCHGGGFVGGVGDADWHDGEQLARHHDVVVVHFNHRLNIFGSLYLAEIGGEKYAHSGNVGMLDIVAALRWVRENIGSFGGDPNNVTVFGESGGGGKVSTLMAMPAAQGLFHKAVVQSGYPVLRVSAVESASRTCRAVLNVLGIRKDRVDRIQEVPAEELLRVYGEISVVQQNLLQPLQTFQPVVDGCVLPQHPFDPAAPRISAQVPMLIGTVRDECGFLALRNQEIWTLDRSALLAHLKSLGISEAQADDVVEAYRATRPGQSLGEILLAIASDRTFRLPAIVQAERKHAQGAAPAYMYYFAWEAPGEFKAGHGIEVPFVFANLDKAPGLRGPTLDLGMDALAYNMSAAWVAFARSGDPNHSGLPTWKPYEPQSRATMVFDRQCVLVNDPQRQDRLACLRAEA